MRKKRMLGIYKLKELIYIITNVIIFNTKAKKLASLHTNSDLTRRSTTLTLNSTKTCEKAGKRKISVLETHYFLL